MATQRNPQNRRSSGGRTRSSFVSFLLGVLSTCAVLLLGGWLYLRFGHLPVAVADPAFPLEARIVHTPLNARIARELEQPPFGTGEDAFETGARLYTQSCASCHGEPGHDSAYARFMYPRAPQLWRKHAGSAVVGVSDDEPGETYWKIRNGIRLSGMPAYQHLLTPAEMWDIALLLKSADQVLPDPVMKLLSAPPSPLRKPAP